MLCGVQQLAEWLVYLLKGHLSPQFLICSPFRFLDILNIKGGLNQKTLLSGYYRHTDFFTISLLVLLSLFYYLLCQQKLWILGLGYSLHTLEDGLFHTKMATKFLFPVWNGKIQKYSASEHKWIQVVDFGLMLIANITISYYNLHL